MNKIPILPESEYKLAEIVWELEPIASGELAKEALKRLNWQRTTTYTVLKKLCDKQVLVNSKAVVTSLVKKEEVQIRESQSLISKLFDNSLPGFIAAYMGDNKITDKEREEILALLNDKKE